MGQHAEGPREPQAQLDDGGGSTDVPKLSIARIARTRFAGRSPPATVYLLTDVAPESSSGLPFARWACVAMGVATDASDRGGRRVAVCRVRVVIPSRA
jgi:hypothetical protein